MDDDDFSSISGDSIPGVVDIRVKKTTKARCPPITVRNKSAIEINNLMSRLGGGGGNYSLRNFEKAVQIKVKCADLFQKITAELVQLNAEFFTHAKPEDALVKIVLSGLPVFEVDDLIEELEKNNIFPREVKVLSKSEGGNRALYLLNFLKGSVKLTQLREAEKASPSPRKFTSNVVAPGLSFASIAAGPGTGSPPGASTDEKEAPNDDLFTVTEFLGLAREMYARLSKCTTREEQFFALHELMVKYIYVH
ncbi:hypothetical protein pipiens_010099 [Culex pipiens pipiens]|uniref:Uncharacterized protein n=1 Tax=Culex pipiens pipiens TaxID=38569 RepID=A0ABD1DBE0_CULPP